MKSLGTYTDDSDRINDCIEALRPDLLGVLYFAKSKGWSADDMGEALIVIGDLLHSRDGWEGIREEE